MFFFELNQKKHANFVPDWIENDFYGLIPAFQSTYGVLSFAQISQETLKSNIPLVFSTYPIKFGIQLARWMLISAMNFQDSDLQIEIVALEFPADIWTPSAFVYFQGQQYIFNNPLLFEVGVNETGDLYQNSRRFGASISTFTSLSLTIECDAQANQFALLEIEGATEIMTTVFGTCVANIDGVGVFQTSSTSLLETKRYIGQ